jgi:uncharacterized protein
MHSSKQYENPRRDVVVDTSRSPYARLRPVPVGAVRLDDPFWAPRMRVNRDVTLPRQHRQCEETGRIDNFRRASGKKQIDFQGIYFNDSDVYKWMEAAAFALASEPSPELKALLDGVIREVADAQDASGYLNTYFTFEREPERYTNLRDLHELYCAGHLLQGAVAHHRATGERTFLDVAVKLADHLCDTFGEGEGQHPGADGHEEIELAMVELYRDTGDERYLHQADFFLSQRGKKPPVVGGSAYHQDHVPFRDLKEVTGHAVRALYYACGAADLYAETGEPALREALDAQWENFHARRQYVTGGAGARWEGEAFGGDYELPNDRAYSETCAAIASVMWNWRMLQLEGDPKYADDLETALYNGVISGLSLDGGRYFYQNPLADRGRHRRQEWFGCACCPPNLARLLSELPGYFTSVSEEGAWVHLYAAGEADLTLPSGGAVRLTTETRYPWDGEVTIRVETDSPGPFTLFLRIPGWCRDASLAVNSESVNVGLASGSFAELHREWKSGDTVRLSLPMPVALLESHPYTANTGRAAVRRGPLVYCLEAVDHPGVDAWDLSLDPDAAWTPEHRDDLLGGVTVLTAEGRARDLSGWDGRLYRENGSGAPTGSRPARLTAIPYYAWANREPGPMQVWIPVEPRE